MKKLVAPCQDHSLDCWLRPTGVGRGLLRGQQLQVKVAES